MQKLVILFFFSLLPYSSHANLFGRSSERLECGILPSIVHGFLAHHISNRKLTPEIEARTVDQFVKRLDPSKTYLLQSDVDNIKTALGGVFRSLGRDCSAIDRAHEIYVKRLKEAANYSKELLNNKNFKFAENTELMIDPNRRKHPINTEQFKAELAKFIQFQISNYLASDMKLPQAKKQLIHRYELNTKRQAELKHDELYSLFLDAFATSLDAHSNYLSKDALDDFEIQMRLSLEGIGAALTWEDGYTTVESLIPGGSAEKSGLIQPKDKIIAVAQGTGSFEQVIDMPLRDVVKLIRGKKGTTVRLTVLRQGPKEATRLVISLKRDKINLQDEAARLVYSTVKDGDRKLKLAIIDLPSFYGDLTRRTRSCYEDVRKLVLQARKEKADGILLDLSKNGGGLLTEAIRIGGLFINRGNVVATQDSRNQVDMLKDENEGVEFNGPMVILTSRLSASASEIVAGALQDYRRAVIVGADHTFGKGTVQAMMNLPAEYGAVKVTTGMFFIPGGRSTQHRGVEADVVVPSIFSTKDIGEKSLDYSLPPNYIPPFRSQEANSKDPNVHWEPVTDDLIKKLKDASSARIAKDGEFKKIMTEIEDVEKKKGIIKLSDSLKKQREAQAEQKTKDLAKKGHRGGRAKTDEEYLKQPQVHEALFVLGDLIHMSSPAKIATVPTVGR